MFSLITTTMKKKIKKQLELLVQQAQKKGSAIGIGHPYQATANTLYNYQEWLNKQVEIVPASQLVH